MKTTATKWAAKAAGTGAMALLLATPAFAQSRSDWNRNDSNRGAQATQTRAGNRSQQYNRGQQQNNGTQQYNRAPQQNNAAQQYNQAQQYEGRGTQTTQTRADNRAQYQRSNPVQNQTAVRSQRQYTINNNYRENQRVTQSGRITSFARERNGYRVNLDRGRSYWVPESFGRGLRVGLSINLGGFGYDNGYVRGVVDQVDYRTGTVWLQDAQSGIEIQAAVGNGYALSNLHRGELVELTGQWVGGGVFDVARVAAIRY
jgi:hypothetical protein